LNLDLQVASALDATDIVRLVNSAYRGDSSRQGWTTEADLLGGQRTDGAAIEEFIEAPLSQRAMLLHRSNTGELLACVQLERRPVDAYLGMLTIHPQHQAAGLGRQLLVGAEEFVQTHWGAKQIAMTVIEQRGELIAWYERRGYQRSGETAAFPYGNLRFGEPKRPDLRFIVLHKTLNNVHDSVMAAP